MGRKTNPEEPCTFWNEEKQVSELRWNGHVLTGTNEATFALLNRLIDDDRYRERLRDELEGLVDRAENVWRGA